MFTAILTVATVTAGNSLDIERTSHINMHQCHIAQELIEGPLEYFGYKKTFTYEKDFVTLNVLKHPDTGAEVSTKCKELNNSDKGLF